MYFSQRRSTRPRPSSLLALALSGLAVTVTACGGSSTSTGSAAPASSAVTAPSTSAGSGTASQDSGDTGAKLTMWTRDQTAGYSKALIDAYNASHKNHVELTVIPNDTYVQKVGQAAGSKTLPDLLAVDVVYSPNFVQQGLYADITSKLKGLPFYDKLGPAHIKAASAEGKNYGVPFKIDSSLIVYNKDLFTKAGLDPENPPKGYDGLYAAAKQIRDKVGGDTYGLSIAGNCGGCQAYTAMPFGVADDHPVVRDDGKTSDLTGDSLVKAFTMYRQAFAEGVVPPSDKTESGATWGASFLTGKIGILPIGSFKFADIIKQAKFSWGILPLTNADGSRTATFVGGDELSITSQSKDVDSAWNFVAWTLSDEAQVEVVAKGGDLPSRTDLADNQYSAKYPQVVQTIKGLATGWTPSAINYNAAFNDPNGPWLAGFRGAVLGTGDVKSGLGDAQKKIDTILADG